MIDFAHSFNVLSRKCKDFSGFGWFGAYELCSLWHHDHGCGDPEEHSSAWTADSRVQAANNALFWRRWFKLRTQNMYPPSNFSYEMGRTWATVQIASQDFFVQTGGVGPPFLYLHSFCSWFLSNHHFHFLVVYVQKVEASNIKSHLHRRGEKRWKKGNSAWHVHGHKQIMKLHNAI